MTSSKAVQERRRHRRIPRAKELAIFAYSDARERPALARGRLIDISAGGAGIRAKEPPPTGAIGELRVQFIGFQLACEAKVVRSWNDGFAVEFADIESHIQTTIDALPAEPDDDAHA